MPEWAEFIGAIVRWIIKGFKTSLRDELDGNLENTWGASYDTENMIIGYISIIVLLGIVFFDISFSKIIVFHFLSKSRSTYVNFQCHSIKRYIALIPKVA